MRSGVQFSSAAWGSNLGRRFHAYLRKQELVVNSSSVSRLLGTRDVFRKRGLSYLLQEMDSVN
jgi:hypothetical protein